MVAAVYQRPLGAPRGPFVPLCRALLALILILALGLLLAPAASAQPAFTGSASLKPNVAGKGSKLTITGSGGSSAQSLRSIIVAAHRGFRFDRRARAKVCTNQEADSFTCPEEARTGRGNAVVTATSAVFGTRDVNVTIDAYLGERQRAGDLAGAVLQFSEPTFGVRRSLRGRVVRVPSGPFGIEVRFESIPDLNQPGVTATLKSLNVTIGASRRVKVRKRVRGRRVTRRVRRHLITNPRRCSGSWRYQVRATFASGSPLTQDGQIPCRRR